MSKTSYKGFTIGDRVTVRMPVPSSHETREGRSVMQPGETGIVSRIAPCVVSDGTGDQYFLCVDWPTELVTDVGGFNPGTHRIRPFAEQVEHVRDAVTVPAHDEHDTDEFGGGECG